MPIADIRSLGRSASSVPLKTATTALRRAVVRAYPSRRRRFALRMSLTFCLLLLRLLDADTYGVGIVGPGRLRRRLYLLLLLSLRQGPRKTAGAGIVALLGQLLQRRVRFHQRCVRDCRRANRMCRQRQSSEPKTNAVAITIVLITMTSFSVAPISRARWRRDHGRFSGSATGQIFAINKLTNRPTRQPKMTSATLCTPCSIPLSLEWCVSPAAITIAAVIGA